MNRLFGLGVVLAMIGCAGGQPTYYEQWRQEASAREAPWRGTKLALESQLDMFRKEPNRSCQSEHLTYAATKSMSEGTLATAAGAYGNALYEVAELRLEIADAAAAAGCDQVARDIYFSVIKDFIGSGYAAYRQRAEVSLAELRA